MTTGFKSFDTLKNVRGLTDEELRTVLANPCTPSNDVSYEDDLTNLLILWLGFASGIGWRRPYQEGDRGELQYPTIQLLTATPFGNISIKDKQISEDKLCVVVSEPKLYRFQLDVYKDNGTAESQQTPAINPAPINSAFDVLNRLQTRLKHHIFPKALSEYCIYAGPGGFIVQVRNMPEELRHSTNEARATAYLEVVCSPENSLSSGTIGSIETRFCFKLNPQEI